ncbi:predicted protein [Verticillium alfalfae VaMs.102]|uniref:Predicted protein n=1 Tax=Verticillium alfalfae (strain VaMs.102 / ATCC MYA-4576 / FGSC 10136) TaxID=526221 RepID=C9SXG1_VERA1|nr:predicted protein [Verticillium alfalfae VaMs.102]EEY23351.1 predicted protein [Verticillium alfalfae VaMs.102]
MSNRLPTFNGRASLERIGRCLAFGCNPDQTALAASLVARIAKRAAPVYAILQGYPARPGFTIPHLRVPANATWQPSATSAGLDATSWQRKADSNATYLAIANEALYQTLAHARDTAPPDLAAQWQALLYGAPPAEGAATAAAAVTIKNARTNIMPSHVRCLLFVSSFCVPPFCPFLGCPRSQHTDRQPTNVPGHDRAGDDTRLYEIHALDAGRQDDAEHRRADAHLVADARHAARAHGHDAVALRTHAGWLVGELDRLSAVENTSAETRLRKANAVLRGIGRDLRRLEEQTWNRADAVETWRAKGREEARGEEHASGWDASAGWDCING